MLRTIAGWSQASMQWQVLSWPTQSRASAEATSCWFQTRTEGRVHLGSCYLYYSGVSIEKHPDSSYRLHLIRRATVYVGFGDMEGHTASVDRFSLRFSALGGMGVQDTLTKSDQSAVEILFSCQVSPEQ